VYKRVLWGLVTAVCAVVMAAPAIASGGTSGNFADPLSNSDNSAQLKNGSWYFDTWPPCCSPMPGFHYSGNLRDNKSDGDWVYTRGKVDGYDWAGGASAENHGGYGTQPFISQKVWGADPPGQGKIQVCRHRGGIYPNICVESPWKYSS